MNALRVWVHYTAKGHAPPPPPMRRPPAIPWAEGWCPMAGCPRVITIHVPYWCLGERTFGARWKQQVRHCLALQVRASSSETKASPPDF